MPADPRPGWETCPEYKDGRQGCSTGLYEHACPLCVRGERPSDATVVAAMEGPDGEDFNAARAALLTARREEGDET